MGRSIDQDVHAAFVEFRAKDDDKCLSVQCIYCSQIRAKNTSRQKQHLLECPGLQGNPAGQARPTSSEENGLPPPSSYGPPSALNGQASNMNATPMSASMSNGMSNGMSNNIANNITSTPTPTFANRSSLPPQPSSASVSVSVSRPTPKTKAPKEPSISGATAPGGSNLPAPALDDVHAAFYEFRAKEEDKCLSVQCTYCNQIRAKNTSRQRQHLLECPTYLNVMKDAIPANNLLHRFDEGDVARSISLPTPTLELDFRVSVKLNPKITIGPVLFGQRSWLSYVGGQWAGRWGKGIVIPGGQDSQLVVKDMATKIDATYLIQSQDEPPAFITCRTKGWWTGSKEILERMSEPEYADTVAANQYKWRITIELESGDDRYAFLNTAMWVGSGCKRGNEVIYDAYRVG